MDGTLNDRYEKLLVKLKSRTHPDGTARKNYKENVAAIRAELATLQERMRAQNPDQG